MRLKVKFGLIDDREIYWYRPVEDFPHLIKFLGRNYEWFMYDTDKTGAVDMILIYSELPSYDPNYNVDCLTWKEIAGDINRNECECGAKFTSFSWAHMFYCTKWTKW